MVHDPRCKDPRPVPHCKCGANVSCLTCRWGSGGTCKCLAASGFQVGNVQMNGAESDVCVKHGVPFEEHACVVPRPVVVRLEGQARKVPRQRSNAPGPDRR